MRYYLLSDHKSSSPQKKSPLHNITATPSIPTIPATLAAIAPVGFGPKFRVAVAGVAPEAELAPELELDAEAEADADVERED